MSQNKSSDMVNLNWPDKMVSSPKSKEVSSLAEGSAYELSVAWSDTFIHLERLWAVGKKDCIFVSTSHATNLLF